MAKKFLTSLDLNKNQLLNAVIHSLSSAPSSPVAGQIYYNTGNSTLQYYSGSAWITLAQGGDLTSAINSAIDALTTDDIEEGANNLYYTESRAKTDAAELLTGATLTNITITGDGSGLTITAENGVTDSDTDDLAEGVTNLYFTSQRALDATASAYDAAGAAATAETNANSYTDGEILTALTTAQGYADTAYNNAVSYADGLTTADIAEDSGYLYFTDARSRTSISSGNNTINYNSSTGEITANTSTMATVSYVDGEITDLTTYVDQEISDSANTVTAAYEAADSTLSNTLTSAYQSADSALETSLTQDFQDADNTVLSTLRSEIAAASQGLDVKESVIARTVSNINVDGGSTPLPAALDGVSLTYGTEYRILVAAQTDPAENGIYVHTPGGDNVWSRADDALELTPGTFVFVEQGDAYADSGFVISTDGDITVGTTGITWTQFSGTGQIVAGNGITKTGPELSVTAGSGITVDGSGVSIASDYAGQASIDTVGTITTGTWNGSTIDVAHGGTGATTLTGYVYGSGTDALVATETIPGSDIDGDITGNAENVNGTVAIANGGTGATTAAGARSNLGATTKYAVNNTTLNPTSNTITWTVSHNLNTSDVTVQMRDLGDGALVEADVVVTDANTVTISWYSSGTVAADAYRTVVVG